MNILLTGLTSLFLMFNSYQVFAFSIGTYNLHNMSDLEGLTSDLKNLNNVSIFAFQEVRFQDSNQNKLLRDIVPANYPYIISRQVARDDAGGIEGHAIVSQFPITKSMVIPLDHTGKKNREALAAWIQIDHQEIMVIDTDHEVQYKDISYLDRHKQLVSLLKALEKINFKGPQIILGDFNTSDSIANWMLGVSGAQEVNITYNFFKDNGWIPTYTSSENDYTFKSWGITEHLDHIFFKNIPSNNISSWTRFDARQGSDHYPIYTFFEL